MFRRILPTSLTLALLCATMPAPALAVSTSSEIQMGKSADEDIVAGSVIETDPLLNQWVRTVTNKLWEQTARKDVPYNIKVIDDSSVNSFATLGGYVYVDTGLLDFVQSDDELAGVLGHETGHIERRHVVTMNAKAQAVNLLLGIASLFSPIIYQFGNLAEAGIMSKLSRVDELQADQYGLLLMSRAGYDPEAMVTMMEHLATLDKTNPDLFTKYLEDHPEPDKRVGHLMGYPQLDPTKRTEQDDLESAVHNFDTARYNISEMEFNQILKKDPNSEQALLDLGQDELALGQVNKSEQTLAEVAQKGTPQERNVAMERIAGLRDMERHRVTLLQPANIGALRDKVDQAQSELTRAATEIQNRRDNARDELKGIQARLESVEYEIPDFSRVQVRPGSRLETVLRNLEGMARSLNSALDYNRTVINNVGSLERNRENGVLKESGDILHDLQTPLAQTPLTADAVALLPSYPSLLANSTQTSGQLIRSVDASRASLAQIDVALGDLDLFLKQLDHVSLNYFDDIAIQDYNMLEPSMQKSASELAQSAVSASQGRQLLNMARSTQLQSRITMLGLGSSAQRYATLTNALNIRFNSAGLDYSTMLHDNLTPGDVAVATIVAADTNSTPAAVVAQSQEQGRSLVEVANARGMHAQALEIMLGLVYLDYTDDPAQEVRGSTQFQGTFSE